MSGWLTSYYAIYNKCPINLFIHSFAGRIPPDAELNEMLKEAPGPLNFTMFLNLFGEKLSGTDPEDTIRNAFAMFDDEGKGFLPEE